MLREERLASFEAAQDDVGVAGVELVGLAGDGVALVDERATLFLPAKSGAKEVKPPMPSTTLTS